MLARTHGGAVSNDVMYELPLRYKAARHQPEKTRIVVRPPAGSPMAPWSGSPAARRRPRWPGPARPHRSHGRHERAQHRRGARDPVRPEAWGDRWHRTARVVRARRSARRADARGDASRRRDRGRRRIALDEGLTTHHEVEAHEPGAARAGPCGDGRGRQLQARVGGVRRICPLEAVDEPPMPGPIRRRSRPCGRPGSPSSPSEDRASRTRHRQPSAPGTDVRVSMPARSSRSITIRARGRARPIATAVPRDAAPTGTRPAHCAAPA